jgi:hypothetical protein
MKVTFLIRERQLPGTALQNAARYDAEAVKALGHQAKVVTLPEGDRLPDLYDLEGELVIVEGAGWVPVEKIQAMTKRNIPVIVRVHAAPEFLYYEFPGTSAAKYLDSLPSGARPAFVSMELATRWKGALLPINYPLSAVAKASRKRLEDGEAVHIGCFGAIRPLKNHTRAALSRGAGGRNNAKGA